MVVRVALEDAEVATDAATEATAGKHADDRFFNHELGLRGHDGLVGADAQTARVATPTTKGLGCQLVAGDLDLLRVRDDDAIAAHHVGRVLGAMLAHEDERDFGGEATEDHSLGVDDVPIWLNVGFLHVSGLAWHVCSFVAPPGMGRESIKIGLFAKMSRGGCV